MKEIFDEDFVKFVLGFTVIVLIGLAVVFWAQSGLDGEVHTSETIEVLPSTATTSNGQ